MRTAKTANPAVQPDAETTARAAKTARPAAKAAAEAPRRGRVRKATPPEAQAPEAPAAEAPTPEPPAPEAQAAEAQAAEAPTPELPAPEAQAAEAPTAEAAAEPAAEPQEAVAVAEGVVVGGTRGGEGPATRLKLLDRPQHAPEILALAAVRALGPQARDWAARTRATYPAATDDGLARLATRRFVRLAGAGGVVSTAFGLLTPVAELTATGWAQAALVLHLAAAYGRDPGDDERAVDLLVLVGVHPSAEVARAALAEATAADVDVEGHPALRAAEAAWRLVTPLSNQARGWLAVRMIARRLPGVVMVTAAVGAAAAVERLGYRARAHYRRGVTAS